MANWAQNTPGCACCNTGLSCGTVGGLPTTLYVQDSNVPGATVTLAYRSASNDWWGVAGFGLAINTNPFYDPRGGPGCSTGTTAGAIGAYRVVCGTGIGMAVHAPTCLCNSFGAPPGCNSGFGLSALRPVGPIPESLVTYGQIIVASLVSVISSSPLLATFGYTTSANSASSWIYGSNGPVSGTLTLSS